jgi:hypothetical protein
MACRARHEGQNEELIAPIVADVQNPVTPIIEASLAGEGFDDTCRMIPRLREIVHYGAAMIDNDLLRVGAVEIYLGHVQPPPNRDLAAKVLSSRAGRSENRERRRRQDMKPHPSGYEREKDHLNLAD